MRITVGRKLFQPGAFSLGRWAYPIGIVSTIWWLFSLAVFSMPIEYPVTNETFNYACVTLGATLILAIGWYYVPRVGARKRYKGPSFDMAAFEARVLSGGGAAKDVEVDMPRDLGEYSGKQLASS